MISLMVCWRPGHLIRGDFRLVERYRGDLHPKVTCPIYITDGRSDPEVTLARAAEWAMHTRASWHIRWFPDDHFYLGTHGPAIIEAMCAIVAAPCQGGNIQVDRRL